MFLNPPLFLNLSMFLFVNTIDKVIRKYLTRPRSPELTAKFRVNTENMAKKHTFMVPIKGSIIFITNFIITVWISFHWKRS